MPAKTLTKFCGILANSSAPVGQGRAGAVALGDQRARPRRQRRARSAGHDGFDNVGRSSAIIENPPKHR
jgi:hypothetical protein